ncbi:glycosyltransferase family 4 protein [Ekhidna sp.]
MKSVLYVSGAIRVSTNSSSSAGGPRAHILGIINSFKDHGWQVNEFIAGNEISEKILEKDTGSTLKDNVILRMTSDLVRIFLRFAYQVKSKRVLKGEAVDVVYERYAAFQEIGSYIRRKTGAKWILESNGLYYYEAHKERKAIFFHWILKWLEKRAYKKCDFLICVSSHLKDLIVEKLDIDPGKILVVPNGVNTEFFDPEKSERHENKVFKVGFIGTLIMYQRLDILIRACVLLKTKGIQINVEIVGDGFELESWRSLARELEVDDYIHFAGKKPWNEVPSIISSFDLGYSVPDPQLAGKYVSPLKIYEYMAMKVPTLAYPTDDARSLINSHTGFLVEDLDPQLVADKIEEAMKSDIKLLGENSRDLILKSHSWNERLGTMLKKIGY